MLRRRYRQQKRCSHASAASSMIPTTTPKRINRASNASRLTTANQRAGNCRLNLARRRCASPTTSRTLAAKTASMLMTIVAVTTHKRSRSSPGLCAFASDIIPLSEWRDGSQSCCSFPFSRCSVQMLDYGRQCSQRVILGQTKNLGSNPDRHRNRLQMFRFPRPDSAIW